MADIWSNCCLAEDRGCRAAAVSYRKRAENCRTRCARLKPGAYREYIARCGQAHDRRAELEEDLAKMFGEPIGEGEVTGAE